MKLQPIPRTSLVDMVVERIRALIDQGPYEAGDRLPGELELVEQLQVSRPVLREAISRMESVGLINVRRGQGMYVGDRGSLRGCVQLVRSAMAISPKDVNQFIELRVAIEVHAARRAAELATPADLEELEMLYRQIDDEDVEHLEAIRYDFRFHRKIVDIVGSEVMSNVMAVIHEFIMAGMIHTTPNPRNRVGSRASHGAILKAIQAGDPDAAETAMRSHMKVVRSALHDAAQGRKPKRAEA